MIRFSIALLLVGATFAAAVGQTVIVNETFDAYADSAALYQVWAPLAGSASPGTPEQVQAQFPLVTVNPDFNGDTFVDAADYTVWRDNQGVGSTQPQGDANQDAVVNAKDYNLWAASFGGTVSGTPNKVVHHLRNFIPAAERLPDGNLVYQPPLDPNFFDGSIFPSDGMEPIVLRGDIYSEDGLLQRNTIALRSFFEGASANLIEMGFNNSTGSQPTGSVDHPEWGAAVGANPDCVAAPSQACAGFGVRLQLFTASPGTNPDWQFFKFDPSWDTNGNGLVSEAEVFARLGGPAWHRFEATISADPEGDHHDIVFTVDLNRDGINNATGEEGVDATITFNDLVTVTQAGFNSLRIGGPSGLYTTSAVMFDNIYLSGPQSAAAASGAAVPEPTSLALSLLTALALLSIRRSR